MTLHIVMILALLGPPEEATAAQHLTWTCRPLAPCSQAAQLNSFSIGEVCLRGVRWCAGVEVEKPEAEERQVSGSVLMHDMKILHRHPVFLLNAYGYVPIQACLGAFTYWGPKAAMQIFDRPKAIADNTIGALTICTSIAGAVRSGLLLESMLGS